MPLNATKYTCRHEVMSVVVPQTYIKQYFISFQVFEMWS